jgi:hypothetical protein
MIRNTKITGLKSLEVIPKFQGVKVLAVLVDLVVHQEAHLKINASSCLDHNLNQKVASSTN